MIKNQIKSRSWTVQYCDKWSNIKQATTQILKMTGNYIRGRAQWTTTQWTLKLGNKNIFYLHNFMSLIICSLYYYFFLWKSSKNFFDNLWWVRWSAIFSYYVDVWKTNFESIIFVYWKNTIQNLFKCFELVAVVDCN